MALPLLISSFSQPQHREKDFKRVLSTPHGSWRNLIPLKSTILPVKWPTGSEVQKADSTNTKKYFLKLKSIPLNENLDE